MALQQVSLDHYRRESMKIAARFKEGLPGCELGESTIQTTSPLPLLNRRLNKKRHLLTKHLLTSQNPSKKYCSNDTRT